MTTKIKLLLFLVFLTNTISAQNSFPSFEEVVTSFFSGYDLRTDHDGDDIRFVKQKDGYFIEEYDAIKETYRIKTLYWSAGENSYRSLGFPENSDPDDDHMAYHLTSFNKEVFNSLPYYGYIGWPKEVIGFLEVKTERTNIEEYALARAYSSNAAHLMNSSYPFADPSEQFDLKESGANQLSQQQLQTYKDLVGKSIAGYSRLCEKNPDFQTIVGGVCNKLHNEYVSIFLNLAIYQNEAMALEFLPEGLYSDFFMDYAKNYLNSVGPNAILFTTGDNDTFPFLYAQAKLQHRRDVLIVNTSLLNQNSYVNHLRNDTIFDSPPIQFTLLPETYFQEKLDVIVLEKDSVPKRFLDLKAVLKLFNSDDSATVYKPIPEYSRLPSNRIAINSLPEGSLQLDYEAQYIVQGELLALDLVGANIKGRPIYCTFNELPIVSNYLEQSGFATKLTAYPQNKIEDNPFIAGIDAEKSYALIVQNFKFHKKTEKHEHTKLSVLVTYALSCYELARHYQNVDDTKKCEEVLSVFTDFYPKDIYLRTDFMILDIIETAYAAGLTDKGGEILDSLLKSMEHEQQTNVNNTTLSTAQVIRQKIFGEEEKRPDKDKLEDYLFNISRMRDLKVENTDLQMRFEELESYYHSEYNKL